GIRKLHSRAVRREQLEIGARRLDEPQWPLGAEHEPPRPDRSEELREVVLRWSPDPGDVPEQPRLLIGRQPPVHFLYHVLPRPGDDEPGEVAGTRELAHRGCRQVAGNVVRPPLPQVLESDGQYHDQPPLAAGARDSRQPRVPRAQPP